MDDAPKSAFEIAMEKLSRQDRDKGEAAPASLTDDQKRRIAEIRRKYEARIAEREILFRGERARAAADPEGPAKLEQVEKEYAGDRARFEAEREREIAAVRSAGGRGGEPGPSSGAGPKPGPAGRRGRGKKGAAAMIVAFALLTSARPVSAEPATPAPRLIALKAARLLDGRADRPQRDVMVLIEGDRIRSVGPSAGASVPAGAELIDLGEATLLPGLIDAHTHLLLQGDATERDYDRQLLKESIPHRTIRAVAAARVALERGFTTLRDLGTEGAGFADVAMRDAIAEGVVPGPRLFVATRALDISGAYPISGFALGSDPPRGVQEVDGPDAGRRAVREQVKYGADWIKVYCDRGYFVDGEGRLDSIPTFEPDELKAIVDEAHRQGRRVAAHAMATKGVARALEAGVDSIEHGAGLDAVSIRTMVTRGTFYCPTLTVTHHVAPLRAAEGRDIWARIPEFQESSFAAALKAGVKIAFGTDAGGFPWDVNQAEEFEYMVRFGMSPAQAIRAATSVAAEMLGQQEELGRVASGYRADLVAVPGDPLREITVMKRVGFVMAAGRVVRNDLKPQS